MGKNLSKKIQISGYFFTIGETSDYNNITIGEFGNNGFGGEGYYRNNYREIYVTKVYNTGLTMELYIFGFATKNDAENANFSINYQPAYGGNTQYPFKKGSELNAYGYGDNKSPQFPSSKYGARIANFGESNQGYPPATKKHNGIYTFKTTYKGKTYTSILHLKLSE